LVPDWGRREKAISQKQVVREMGERGSRKPQERIFKHLRAGLSSSEQKGERDVIDQSWKNQLLQSRSECLRGKKPGFFANLIAGKYKPGVSLFRHSINGGPLNIRLA